MALSRRKVTRSSARSYRRHRKHSRCHGLSPAACAQRKRCRVVKGKSRRVSYCRKRHNTRRR